MTEEPLLDQSSAIDDGKLRKLWKMAVTSSLDPENHFPAYKIYYYLLRKEILLKYVNSKKEETLNDEENLHD